MIELLIGGILRLLPEITRVIDKERDRVHEREMLKLQTASQVQIASKEAETAEMRGELAAMKEATRVQGAMSGFTGKWYLDAPIAIIDLLSKTVRPVLTYWFCIAGYGGYKAALIYGWLAKGFPLDQVIVNVWTEQDWRIVLSIIGFWFVDRAIRHLARQ